MRVLNQGHPGRFFAKVLRPVEGIAESGYGDFYVQWDLEADIEKKLERGEAHTLHVAALKDRTLRFLGPETVYGKQTLYKGVKVSSPEVRILVRFCDTGAGVDRVADCRIELDHENVPTIRFDGWLSGQQQAQIV
jgi:hypothetical protein